MQYEPAAALPQPDESSRQHCEQVSDHLRNKIADAGGSISFAEFMHEALYAPGLGYYSAGSIKFGAGGDFVTAPEVSPVFGRIVARQVAEVLASVEGGAVLEIGAGSGRLAVDMLTALEALDALPGAYNILEVSAELQGRQERRLRAEIPHLAGRVRWLCGLPQDFEGVIVANEVLDALPVERFVRRDRGVFQIGVSWQDNKFTWLESLAAGRLLAAVNEIEAELGRPLDSGYMSEVSLAAPLWIEDLASSLQRGAAFLFDYGISQREYYASDRSDGWLRCHFRHHAHSDPLIYPGIQDLTAWVDFTRVADAAVANGLDLLGYQTQAQFLMGGGLELEMQHFLQQPVEQQLELSGQVKTLTLPGEMGENFKCIALGRGEVDSPSAFHFADRTQTL